MRCVVMVMFALCVVRWPHPESPAKSFALAEVSLTEIGCLLA